MRITKNLWWQNLTGSIVGYDDDGEGSGASSEGASEGANGAEEGPGEGEGSAGTGDGGNPSDDPAAGLKSALQKERNEKKALEKELRAFRKAQEDKALAEKSEAEQATSRAEKAEQKAAKLAAGFRRNALHQAVLKAASNAKFRDPSDALRPEVLEIIGVEQDEDDPTDISINEADVQKAIKDLAKSKPHYLATGDGQQRQQRQRSGSSFGGNGGGNQTPEQAELLKKYPALANTIR